MSKVFDKAIRKLSHERKLGWPVTEIKRYWSSEASEVLNLEQAIKETTFNKETKEIDCCLMLLELKGFWIKVERDLNAIEWNEDEESPRLAKGDPILKSISCFSEKKMDLVDMLVSNGNKEVASNYFFGLLEDDDLPKEIDKA